MNISFFKLSPYIVRALPGYEHTDMLCAIDWSALSMVSLEIGSLRDLSSSINDILRG